MANPMVELYQKERQSPWLDFIRRNMLKDGGLRRYVSDDGIRGVTANPTIFAQAIIRDDRRPVTARGCDLGFGGIFGHHDYRGCIDGLRRNRHRLRVIAGGVRHDPA